MTTVAAPVPSLPRGRVRPLAHWEDRLAQGLLLASCAVLAVFLLAPLAMILVKSTEDKSGAFVGLQLFREYLQNAALRDSAFNTLWVALVVTAVTVPLAFTFAYALTRSCIPAKSAFRLIALTPILSPSMLAAISFIQWFGNQGALKSWLFGNTVYESLGTPRLRKCVTITLPGARYGLVSAAMVVFSYNVSDFGIPKVIGGNFNE